MPTSDRFTKEKRDEAWAPARESAIRAQIDSLSLPGSVTVSAIECRAALCRMSLSGTVSGEFQRSLERLQGPDGFYKRAQQMHVANYTRGANGKPSSLTIYLEYGR